MDGIAVDRRLLITRDEHIGSGSGSRSRRLWERGPLSEWRLPMNVDVNIS